MKLEIEIPDNKLKQVFGDITHFGYKIINKEQLIRQIINDLFNGPVTEIMGYDNDGIGDSEEPEDLAKWGCERVDEESEGE